MNETQVGRGRRGRGGGGIASLISRASHASDVKFDTLVANLPAPCLDSFQATTGNFSVMVGTLLYLLDPCGRHSKLTEELYIPLRPIPKEDTLSLTLLSTGQLTETGRPKYLTHGW